MNDVAIIINARPDVPARGIFYRRWVKPAAERQKCAMAGMSKTGQVGALRNEAARDVGCKNAEWLLFLDDDKVLADEAVAMMLSLGKTAKADLIYCDYLGIAHPGSEHPCGPVWRHKGQRWSPETLRRGNYIDTCSLVRRELFEEAGGWAEDLDRFLDWDLWLRCAEAGATGLHIPEVLFHTHYLPGPSITRDFGYAESRRKVVERHGL